MMDSKLVYFFFASGVSELGDASSFEKAQKMFNNGVQEKKTEKSYKAEKINGIDLEKWEERKKQNREALESNKNDKKIITVEKLKIKDLEEELSATGFPIEKFWTEEKGMQSNTNEMKERKEWLQNFLVNRPFAPEEYCRNYNLKQQEFTKDNCPLRYCKIDGTRCEKKYSCDSVDGDSVDELLYCHGTELIKDYNEVGIIKKNDKIVEKKLPDTFYANIDTFIDKKSLQEELRYFCRSLYLQEVKLNDDEIVEGKIILKNNETFCTWPYKKEAEKRCESHNKGNKEDEATCNRIIAEQSPQFCEWDKNKSTCGAKVQGNNDCEKTDGKDPWCDRCKSITEKNFRDEKKYTAVQLAEKACNGLNASPKICEWNGEKCQTSEKSGLFGLTGTGLMLGRGADNKFGAYTQDDHDKRLEEDAKQGRKYGQQDTFMTKYKDTVKHMINKDIHSIEGKVGIKKHFVNSPMLSQSDEAAGGDTP